jgi:hypothetical protein
MEVFVLTFGKQDILVLDDSSYDNCSRLLYIGLPLVFKQFKGIKANDIWNHDNLKWQCPQRIFNTTTTLKMTFQWCQMINWQKTATCTLTLKIIPTHHKTYELTFGLENHHIGAQPSTRFDPTTTCILFFRKHPQTCSQAPRLTSVSTFEQNDRSLTNR